MSAGCVGDGASGLPDDAPDGMESMVRAVYPNGWEVNALGTHIQAKAPAADVANSVTMQ